MFLRIKKFLIIELLTLLCICYGAGELPDGVHSPEDLHAYIIGLSTRNFHDLVLEQSKIFHQRYPKHPLGEAVYQMEIKAYSETQNYPEAIKCVKEFLQSYPKGKQADNYRLFAASCQKNLGQFSDAVSLLKPLLSHKNESIAEEARYISAECLLELQKIPEAEEQLKYLSSLPPREKRPERLRARYYFALKQHQENKNEEALQSYQNLLSNANLPDELRAQILLNLGQLCYVNMANPAEAASFYGKFSQEYPNNPMCRIARRMLMFCKFRLEEYASFLSLYEQYEKSYPQDAEKDMELRWMEVQSMLKMRRYTYAIPILKQLSDNPLINDELKRLVLRLYVSALYDTNQFELVISAGQQYLSDFPNADDKAEVLNQCGIAAKKLGKHELAIDYLRKAMPLSIATPNRYCDIGVELALLLEKTQQWPAASRVWDDLINVAEKNRQPQLLLQAANCAIKQGNDTSAIEYLRKLTAQFKDLPDQTYKGWQMMFTLAVKHNNINLALDAANALSTHPSTPPAEALKYTTIIATIYLSQKRYDEATAQYVTAYQFAAKQNLPHAQILGTLIQLELSRNQLKSACHHGTLFFDLRKKEKLPPLSNEVLLVLSNAAIQEKNLPLAENALHFAINNISQQASINETASQCFIHLASLLFAKQHYEAVRTLLEQLTRLRHASGLTDSPDASALLAEAAYMTGDYTSALANADRALQNSANALWPETRPRALYIKAKHLYEKENAKDAAFKCATLCFIGPDCEPYSPRALKLAIAICKDKGEKKNADELSAELKKRFPNFLE